MSYAVGINNGNFRSGEYQAWATQDLSHVPTFTQLCDVSNAVRNTFETQEAYDAWRNAAPKYDGFFAYAEAYLLEVMAQDRQHVLLARRDSLRAAFVEEPLTVEQVVEITDELAEIETVMQREMIEEDYPF